jgi:glycosyltransferase involved in cell wall biosynthesis
VTPFYRQTTVGNAVTVRRIEDHLRQLGCITAVFSLDAVEPERLNAAVAVFSPDIVHAFHGTRCGELAAEISKETRRPFIITFTGTDIYRGDGPAIPAQKLTWPDGAAALVVFHEVVAGRVTEVYPELAARVKTIPQGVDVPDNGSSDILPEAPFVFLLPAGIRPVKNILSSFSPIEQLWRRYPQIRLLLAGPVLDKGYYEKVRDALARYPFASWLGEVPHAAMPALYRSGHVVLNTSLSEGGMANSILEAMAFGRPVLVSAIEGNRSLVTDGENGLLFASDEEFVARAERLLRYKALRESLATAGRSYVVEHCSADLEAKRYLELYMKVLKSSKESECLAASFH